MKALTLYVIFILAVLVGSTAYQEHRQDQRNEAMAVLLCSLSEDCTVPQEVLDGILTSK